MVIVTQAPAGLVARGATPLAPMPPAPTRLALAAAPHRRRWGRGLLVAAGWALAGCGGDSFQPPKPPPLDQVYWTLELNHHAVTLSTSPSASGQDTLTLVATARTADGTLLSGLPPVKYVSRDPERIVVTPDGLLRAMQPTGGHQVVAVVATLIANNLKHIDSVLVLAVDEPAPPVLDRFSIHPVPPDSAKVGAEFPVTCFALPQQAERPFLCSIVLPVTLLDAAGAPIAAAAVDIRSADPRVLNVQPDGLIYPGQDTGTTTLYASATVFGVRRADTLPFRVGRPIMMNASGTAIIENFSWLRGFAPAVKIGVSGVVLWSTSTTDTIRGVVDITFADSTHVEAADLSQPSMSLLTLFCSPTSSWCFNGPGNVVLDGSASPITGYILVLRRFPVPGVYDYHSTALGTSGRIVVVDER